MIRNNYTCGIDIGTSATRVVVVGYKKGDQNLSVLATGLAETEGIRRGYIINIDQVSRSITKAVQQAETTLGFKIKKAFVSIGGIKPGSGFGWRKGSRPQVRELQRRRGKG